MNTYKSNGYIQEHSSVGVGHMLTAGVDTLREQVIVVELEVSLIL